MTEAVALTKPTALQLRDLLNANKGGKGGNVSGGGGSRQTIHVYVASDIDEDGYYPCLPTAYQPSLGVWEDYEDGDALVFEANGEPLKIGHVYKAIRYGYLLDGSGSEETSDSGGGIPGSLVFVTDVDPVGCGLFRDDDGVVKLDAITIAGDGLRPTGDSGCETLGLDLCTTTWTVLNGSPTVSIVGSNLVVAIPTATRRLAIVSGKLCHEQVATSSVSGSLALSCTEVVTSVSCVDGEIVGTTTPIRHLGSC